LEVKSYSFIDFGLKKEVVDEEFRGIGIVLRGEISRIQNIFNEQENPPPSTEAVDIALIFTVLVRICVVAHLYLDLAI
jgi:hypothetical protein